MARSPVHAAGNGKPNDGGNCGTTSLAAPQIATSMLAWCSLLAFLERLLPRALPLLPRLLDDRVLRPQPGDMRRATQRAMIGGR